MDGFSYLVFTILEALTFLKSSIEEHFCSFMIFCPTSCASFMVRYVCGAFLTTKELDSPIALLNKPLANGDVHIAEILEEPALSPAIVMLSLSPPK